MSVESEVREVIAEHMSLPLDQVEPKTLLAELGMQSMDLVSVIYKLERRVGVEIVLRAEEIPVWETCDVAWVAKFVASRKNGSAAVA